MSKALDRSAESVEDLFAAIREALAVHPDWRVGQVLVNACAYRDPFYSENDEIARRIRERLESEVSR